MAKKSIETYPMLPVAHWWKLRDRFKKSIPGVVTDNYLATTLDTQPKSARANVLPFLKDLGLIDEDGKTLELAKEWRDDEKYADVCAKMCKTIYPEELVSAVTNPLEDRAAVERWFANQTGAGDGAVKRMSAIYIVISDGDISKKPQKLNQNEGGNAIQKSDPKNKDKQNPPRAQQYSQNNNHNNMPGLNINIEIHISADATPDQIDKIFESMAKHLYKK